MLQRQQPGLKSGDEPYLRVRIQGLYMLLNPLMKRSGSLNELEEFFFCHDNDSKKAYAIILCGLA